jgi:hypothetical protein
MDNYTKRFERVKLNHEDLLNKKNEQEDFGNGIFDRYKNPILTAQHAPLIWRYDFDPAANPFMMERIGVNAVLNSGAMKWNGKYLIVVRVEGMDRKSFFAIAESPNGIDNFRFWDEPITIPETENPDTNVYDMRPQDGFIDAGSGGGIGWALIDDMANAEVNGETIINQRFYHTIKEVKNGEGPHPIKTEKGWLHLAHGVRNCAAGLPMRTARFTFITPRATRGCTLPFPLSTNCWIIVSTRLPMVIARQLRLRR